MTRESIKEHFVGMSSGFRFRGTAQTRIETFSDAVFALAVALLLISSKPPGTFEELWVFATDLVPFAMCFTLIGVIWFQHFMFFFRYGLLNAYIFCLNLVLLFTVLFYVYPLKFLTTMLSHLFGGLFFGMTKERAERIGNMISWEDVGYLMAIYGAGAICIFITLALMYRYALKKADDLDLNELERFDTRSGIYTNVLMASVPLLSVLMALLLAGNEMAGFYSGMVYNLYWPVMFVYGYRRKKKRNRLLAPDQDQGDYEIPEESHSPPESSSEETDRSETPGR